MDSLQVIMQFEEQLSFTSSCKAITSNKLLVRNTQAESQFSSMSHQSTLTSWLTRQTSISCPSGICSPFEMILQPILINLHLLINHIDSLHNESITLQPNQLQAQRHHKSGVNLNNFPSLSLLIDLISTQILNDNRSNRVNINRFGYLLTTTQYQAKWSEYRHPRDHDCFKFSTISQSDSMTKLSNDRLDLTSDHQQQKPLKTTVRDFTEYRLQTRTIDRVDKRLDKTLL
ncbi:hypothetical protein TIFTF001_040743 [Ficus carica]|uniref:Uncharacterized protein n=1 Tax=Ficus carica TaxID=3494 RepID=A0AA88D357_FICCA|nr:hypothetical protein TIFTF001_040722 [Ficus carica]GMN25554.1 hypothetical protein TIFTF001_040732 [Ficus carica]GMN25586.1 hypothetical protein TIFTF001_040739 [Ficus carica]GMN25619.1 hypothetical protein TIFTF001_040743 [Ficus carica]